MIRHVVALKFKAGTEQSVKQSLYNALKSLDQEMTGILDFQSRENISVETQMVRGFRDLFWFDFKDEATRDAYLENETHQQIGARLVAELEGGADGVFVMDFEP